MTSQNEGVHSWWKILVLIGDFSESSDLYSTRSTPWGRVSILIKSHVDICWLSSFCEWMKLIFAHLLHTCAFWCVASCCSVEWTAWKVQIMNRNCDPMNNTSLVTMKFSLFNFRKYIWVENNQRLLDKSKKQDELYAMKCWRMFVRQVFCLETKKMTHMWKFWMKIRMLEKN